MISMLPCTDYERIVTNLVDAGVKYITENSIQSMVIGLSGGVDSAVTAKLARKVSDKTNTKLIGYVMPCVTNSDDETFRGTCVGVNICDEFSVCDLNDAFYSLLTNIDIFLYLKDELSFEDKVRAGNIKARLRMINLYNMAAKHKGLVLSTDNYTEYLLGFWTLHGDVGDLGFIQQLWKTEVYGMANYLCVRYNDIITYSGVVHWMGYSFRRSALMSSIDAIPTDGLGVTNSDFDQLGVENYQEADKILIKYINTNSKDLEGHPVIERHIKYAFKRENPYNITRENILPKSKPIVTITKNL